MRTSLPSNSACRTGSTGVRRARLGLQAVGRDEGVERARGGRTLDRDERGPVGVVRDEHVVPGGALLHGLDGDVAVAGVRDDEEDVLAGAVDHQVVEDPALGREQQRVLRPADRHRAEGPGERGVEEGHGVRTLHADLGHVREVEHPGRPAHRVVLGEVGRVPDRHAVPGEVGEGGAGGFVLRLERRRAERGRTGTGRGAPASGAPGAGTVEGSDMDGVLPASAGPDDRRRVRNSPSVMGLRVSPRPVRSGGFHRGRDGAAWDAPTSIASAFQSGLPAAVLDLRDWRGACSFGARTRSCSVWSGALPRRVVGRVFCCPRSIPSPRYGHVSHPAAADTRRGRRGWPFDIT